MKDLLKLSCIIVALTLAGCPADEGSDQPSFGDEDTGGEQDTSTGDAAVEVHVDTVAEVAPVDTVADSSEEVSLAIVSPEDKALVGGVVTLEVLASHPSGIASVMAWLEGHEDVTFDGVEAEGDDAYTIELDTSIDATGGPLYISVMAISVDGPEATETLAVYVDNKGPFVSILSPEAGELVTDSVSIAFKVADLVGVESIRVLVGDKVIWEPTVDPAKNEEPYEPYQQDWDASHELSGPRTFWVEATDTLGNTTQESVDINIYSVPSFRVAKTVTVVPDSKELTDHSLCEWTKGDKTHRYLLVASKGGVYEAKIDSDGGLSIFEQITTAPADAVHCADMSGDDVPELIVVEQHDEHDYILGVYHDWTTKTPVLTEHHPVELDISASLFRDMTNDGALDVVLATVESFMSLVTFHGTGTTAPVTEDPLTTAYFGEPEITAGIVGIVDMEAGDFSVVNQSGTMVGGDGYMDLALGRSGQSSISVVEGTPDGSFVFANDTFILPNMSAVASGTMDQDGILDIVAIAQSSDMVVMLRGKDGITGTGYFDIEQYPLQDHPIDPMVENPAPQGLKALTGDEPTDLITLDIDDDGNLDVVTANSKDGNLSVYFGDGFGWLMEGPFLSVGPDPKQLAAYHLNDDEYEDLVLINGGVNTLTVVMGRPEGQFTAAIEIDMPTVKNYQGEETRLTPKMMEAVSVDNYGPQDLLVITEKKTYTVEVDETTQDYQQTPLFTYLNDGILPAAPPVENALPKEFNAEPTAMTVGNFGGGPYADIAVTFNFNSSSADIYSLLLMYGKTTPGVFEMPTVDLDDDLPRAMAIDAGLMGVTGDALDDLIIAYQQKGNISSSDYEPPVYRSYLTDAAQVLIPVQQPPISGEVDPTLIGDYPADILLEDLNNDGLLDFISVNSGVDGITVAYGLGNGVFDNEKKKNISVGDNPQRIAVGLIDEDEYKDAVILINGNIVILFSNEEGSGFLPPVYLYADGVYPGSNPSDLVIADLNGDDKDDIVVTQEGDDVIRIYLIQEDTSYVGPYVFHTGNAPRQVIKGHFNDDECVDLAVLNALGKTIQLLVNDKCGD